MAQQPLFASAPAGQLKRVAGGSGLLHLTWNRAVRKTLRELGIEQQGWQSGTECDAWCDDRTTTGSGKERFEKQTNKADTRKQAKRKRKCELRQTQ